MRTTYTKPNSFSQLSATESLSDTKSLLAHIGMSRNAWIELFFEMGCLYAELRAPDMDIAHTWLTDPTCEFWNMWLAQYLKDDKELMESAVPPQTIAEYKQLKEAFV